MAMRIKGVDGNLMENEFFLRENPFRQAQIYNPDQPGPYVPEMYGDQLLAFYKRFFILPMMKDTNKQVIGAIWSSHTGDAMGKGFGKSMLMAEESRLINHDFGASLLKRMEVVDEDIQVNPILAGYCTFDQAKDVKSFPAALLDAVTFILESPSGDTHVHGELRRRIIEKIKAPQGYEGEAIRTALLAELAKFRTLNFQFSHKTLDGFISRLASDDTADLVDYTRHEIGPRIKAAQGFNFVHVFNAFVRLAGVVYIVYFVDQIENFAKFVRAGDRDVKILRESMCQTSPTAEMASFIFQMHINALDAISDWWQSEHLPSLDYSKKSNETRIIDLQGLESSAEAVTLATRYLANYRTPNAQPRDPLHPFSEDIIEAVRSAEHGNPRDFLRALGNILDHAVNDNQRRIDHAYIQPLLQDDYKEEPEDNTDDLSNPVR